MNIPTSPRFQYPVAALQTPLNKVIDKAPPPGSPSQQRERMPVSGNPRAESNRPDQSPGRIPVASPILIKAEPSTNISEDDSEMLEHLNGIPERTNNSKEIRLLRAVGLIRDNETPPKVSHKEQPTKSESGIQSSSIKEIFDENEVLLKEGRNAAQKIDTQPKKSDPLALDLDGDGLETTGLENGIYFDIDGDGIADQTSFISGGDAFVALDRNRNGVIDNGKELFGDQNGDANGYEALSHYDNNRDGLIDRKDAVYNQLRLLTIDKDGLQQLYGLEEAGIASISVNYINHEKALNKYDSIMQTSTFERHDGSKGESGDLLLGYNSHV